jgi:hypothetical protein
MFSYFQDGWSGIDRRWKNCSLQLMMIRSRNDDGNILRKVKSTDSTHRSFSLEICGFSDATNVIYDFESCKLFSIEILNDFLNHSWSDETYFFLFGRLMKKPLHYRHSYEG